MLKIYRTCNGLQNNVIRALTSFGKIDDQILSLISGIVGPENVTVSESGKYKYRGSDSIITFLPYSAIYSKGKVCSYHNVSNCLATKIKSCLALTSQIM